MIKLKKYNVKRIHSKERNWKIEFKRKEKKPRPNGSTL